jgi:D-threo-aldose 1-dehydrogenase
VGQYPALIRQIVSSEPVDRTVPIVETPDRGTVCARPGRLRRQSIFAASPLIDLGVFDVVLRHNHFILIDRSADTLIDQAASAGIGVLNAAVYGGGILAASRRRDYAYTPASGGGPGRGRRNGCRMSAVRMRSGDRGPAVFTARPAHRRHCGGITKPERIAKLVDAASLTLSDDLWHELERPRPPSP